MMQVSVKLLLSLIDDILDMVKLEKGDAFKIHPQRFMLGEMMKEIYEMFRI